jgi:nucleotide-binding universal stress UspA family protein
MTPQAQVDAAPGPTGAAPAAARRLRDVLCAIDDTAAAEEAARQALALVDPDGRVTFLAVPEPGGLGFPETAFTPPDARAALERALALADEAGVAAEAACEETLNAGEVVVRAARGRDLLVVGEPELARLSGIFLGSVATAAAHFHPASVLIARAGSGVRPFPATILVASDGSERSEELVDLAAGLARRRGSRLALVHATPRHPGEPERRFLAQAVRLRADLGLEPVVHMEPGMPHAVVVQAARRERADLLLVASRGLEGLRALGSVSERVSHEAPCSVLILDPGR